MHGDDGLANLLHLALVRHLGGILHHDDFAVALDHFVHHTRRGGDQILVKLALEALLHDLHVQQAQEAAAEAKAQRLRHLRLVMQGCIVELEFFQCIT